MSNKQNTAPAWCDGEHGMPATLHSSKYYYKGSHSITDITSLSHNNLAITTKTWSMQQKRHDTNKGYSGGIQAGILKHTAQPSNR